MPRVLWKRPSLEKRALQRAWGQLERELGPFTETQRWEAARVAQLRLAVEERTAEWMRARDLRRLGKGRRPNAEHVHRLEERKLAAEDRLIAAMDRLRELVGGTRAPDLARQFAQAHDPMAYNGTTPTAGLKEAKGAGPQH